jgi:S-adenosylmethionine-diacylglycerol 3-amino-3-carboxypropyl transferase
MSTATPMRPAAGPALELAQALGGELRYSRVWEDHLLLERGLGVGPDDELLLIASAGCNVLNLLLQAPRRIVAIDFNAAQTALVQLKLAGFRGLNHDGLLELLGITRGDPLARYDTVRPLLPWDARDWWDANTGLIAAGIEGAGRLDAFLARFQREQIARIHSPALINRLFTLRTAAERRAFVDGELFTPEFETAFRAYFARDAFAARGGGRHPAQFRYVTEADVGGWFLGRLRWVCTDLPARGNFYLERFLRGGTGGAQWLPPYLAPEHHDRLRALVSRVEVVTSDLESYLATAGARRLTKAGLSDVFEYMAPEHADGVFAMLASTLPRHARIAYWNLFVPRESPVALRGKLRPIGRLARSLSRQDRAWFYGAFRVEEVRG